MVETRNLKRKEADEKQQVSSSRGFRKSARHHRLGVTSSTANRNPKNRPLSGSEFPTAELLSSSNNRKKRSRFVSESPSVKNNSRPCTISRKGTSPDSDVGVSSEQNDEVSRSGNQGPSLQSSHSSNL